MEEKSLVVKKDNIFTKMSNFIKRIFSSKSKVETQNIEDINKNDNVENKVIEVQTLDDEYKKIVESYEKYESHELELSSLSVSELENLNNYYEVKISDLSKKRDEIINKIILIKEELETYENV